MSLSSDKHTAASTPQSSEQARQHTRPDQRVKPNPANVADIADIADIAEEEELLETVTSMIIADAAAEAAAEAEARAEACSVRAREARERARLAKQQVARVRAEIRDGTLTGEEAAHTLQQAQQEANRAHTIQIEAEAAEERALKAAINTEAEAEVTEGMSFAAGEQWEHAQQTAVDERDQQAARLVPPQETE